MHMVCTTSALIYYQSFTNGVHPMCTSSALCVTLSSVSTVYSVLLQKQLANLSMSPILSANIYENEMHTLSISVMCFKKCIE